MAHLGQLPLVVLHNNIRASATWACSDHCLRGSWRSTVDVAFLAIRILVSLYYAPLCHHDSPEEHRFTISMNVSTSHAGNGEDLIYSGNHWTKLSVHLQKWLYCRVIATLFRFMYTSLCILIGHPIEFSQIDSKTILTRYFRTFRLHDFSKFYINIIRLERTSTSIE